MRERLDARAVVPGQHGGGRRGRTLALRWAAGALTIGIGASVAGSGSVSSNPCAPRSTPPPAITIRVPDPDIGVRTLEERRLAQLATSPALGVAHDFRFTDRLLESGISFVHGVVDDAGSRHKAVHYDHGTGLAAADVDGDGRPDLYFVNQLGSNQLWRNLGSGRFEDITQRAGVAVPGRVSVGASFADVDNDGDQDLYVTTVRGGNVLFVNDGHGRFRDVSREVGLDYVGHSSGAVFFDYDRDGLLDLFLVNVGKYTTDKRGCGGYFVGISNAFLGHLSPDRTERSVLYRNRGTRGFTDTSRESDLVDEGWSGDASAVDMNEDGYPDLYVLNMQGENHFYENQRGRRFVDRTSAYFPKTPWGAMGLKFFDWNNDGRIDLLVTDMHSDMFGGADPGREHLKAGIPAGSRALQGSRQDRIMFGNAFYENRGKRGLVEISDLVGLENYWPWGPSVGDLNADGWEDVFIAASMSYPFRYGVNSVLLNDRGKRFAPSEFILGVEPRRAGRTATFWFETDCPQYGKGCRGRTGRATVLGTLGTRSSVILDLDGDGDLDIVTNDYGAEPMVLVSDLAQRRPVRWVAIRLEGRRSNRNALGATVRVVAGGATYTKPNDGKSGYLSQSVLPLYFGLGDAAVIDRIEVVWPSGTRQVVTEGLRLNSTLEIVEPP